MAGMLIYTLYSITDWIFVGRLGSDAVAALSFTVPLVFFALGVTFGLGTGATSVIARFLGADNKKQADNAARHAILIGLAVAIAIVAGALLFKHEILTVLGTSGHVRELAVIYFEIIALSFIFGLLNVSFRSIMTGEGNTRTPVMIQACGTVLNIILDPVLIFWAELGIAGAAWATFASQLIVFVIFIYYIYVRRASYLDLRFTRFSFDRKLVYGILSVGIPASGAMLIMSSGSMFFNRIISVFGNEAVAGFGVGGRLDAVYFMPTFAIATSQVTPRRHVSGGGPHRPHSPNAALLDSESGSDRRLRRRRLLPVLASYLSGLHGQSRHRRHRRVVHANHRIRLSIRHGRRNFDTDLSGIAQRLAKSVPDLPARHHHRRASGPALYPGSRLRSHFGVGGVSDFGGVGISGSHHLADAATAKT